MKVVKKKHAITAPRGFKASGVTCRIKKRGRDLALVFSQEKAYAAAVFTTNRVKAWPLLVDKKHLRSAYHQAIIVNSGNANCSNGAANHKKIFTYCKIVARSLHISPYAVLPSSTGIIGRDLPVTKIIAQIPVLVRRLSSQGGHNAARGILTTDTHTKEAVVSFQFKGRTITIGAMAKGAGMLQPHMATMLAYFTTDLNISKRLLQQALSAVTATTFNMINVDNDMSTNDTVMMLANGAAGNPRLVKKDAGYHMFIKALQSLAWHLAKALVRDGEGVTRICEISIRGAHSEKQAVQAARAIGVSMLFKTALHGADPNWGRVVAVLGALPHLECNFRKLTVAFGPYIVFKNGKPYNHNLPKARQALRKKEVQVSVNLAAGRASTQYITSDLTKNYISLNAEYTT